MPTLDREGLAVLWSRLTWGLLVLCTVLIAHDTLCVFLKVSCDYYRRLHQGSIGQGITLIGWATIIALCGQLVLSVLRRRFQPLFYQLVLASVATTVKMAGFAHDPFVCAFDSWR